MPVIKSAIKKLRKDRKRERVNDEFRTNLDRAVRAAKKQKTAKTVSSAVSIIDKAVKKNVMHKNKAARIKSALSKLAKPASKVSAPKAKPVKKSVATSKAKKTPAKKTK